MNRNLWLGYGGAVFTVVCWSFNFPMLRYALAAYDPWQLATLRMVFAALVLIPLAALGWRRLPLGRHTLAVVALGGVGVGGSTFLLAWGLLTVTAGSASFVIATVPIFSALLAHGFLGERVGRVGWLGIGVSLGGIALIVLGEGGNWKISAGGGFLIGSAVCQAVYYVFQKPFHQRYTPIQITAYAVWGSALAALLVAPDTLGRMVEAPLGATLAAFYMGAISLAAAFITWSFALSHIKAARVTSTMYAMPLLSFLEAWLWLGEIPPVTSIAGGGISLAGVAILGLWGK